jgi:hypothetical protein
MGNRKLSQMSAAQMGLTLHEEKLLKLYFSRRVRPYLVAIGVLVCVLGVSVSVGVPGTGADAGIDEEQLSAEIESASVALQEQLGSELAALRSELVGLSEELKRSRSAPASATDAKARKRLDRFDGAMSGVRKRLGELEERTQAAASQLVALEDREIVEESLAESDAAGPGEAASVEGLPFE